MKNNKLIALICSAGVVFSCVSKEDPLPAPYADSLLLAGSGNSAYSLVYSSSKTTAEGLNAFFKDKAGVTLPLVSDSSAASDYEIIVGQCSRPESIEVQHDLDGTFGYSASVVGSKLVIAASDVTWAAFALRAVVKEIKEKYIEGRQIVIPKDFKVQQLMDDPQMIARLIRQGYDFTLSPVLVLTHPPVDDIYVAQGAASDGEYFYFVLRNSGDTKAQVYKYRIKTKSLVAESKIFNGGHCNDLTYDAGRKQVILAHGQSQGQILTPIDAATLEVLPDIHIPVGSGAITYNASRDSYAISQGGSTFYVTDSGFNVTLHTTRTDKTGYTAQGMGSDDSYVYFPMSKSKTDNVLVVYDWKGKFVSTLKINLTVESESMFYAAGRYYVAFYSGSKVGLELYEMKPVHYYSYVK